MNTIRTFAAAVMATLFAVTLNAQTNVTYVAPVVPDNAEEMCALVDGWFEAKVTSDFDAMRNAMDDEFMIMGIDEKPLNADQYIELWKGYGEGNAAQGIKSGVQFAIHVEEGEFSGDWVYYTAEATWTLKGTDTPVNSWFTNIAMVKDGKIILSYHFQDNLPVMMQMGFTMTPPAWMTQQSEN